MTEKKFLIIGGDSRQLRAAETLALHGGCEVAGFDKALRSLPAFSGGQTRFQHVILPLPATRDGVSVNAPFHGGVLSLASLPELVKPGGDIFAGKAPPELESVCKSGGIALTDYFAREELAVMNAVPTAEGTLEIILRESQSTIFGMNVLITGYGRISRVLASRLVSLGANVTICARKYSDLAWINIAGARAARISDLPSVAGDFDTIINTVPAPVFTPQVAAIIRKDALVVDLASETGFAPDSGVRVIWALSLPGKCSPVSSGKIIAETILNILSERENQQ